VLSLQESPGNSAGPEIDGLARVLRDLGVNHDVCNLEAPSGLQHAVDLREDRVVLRSIGTEMIVLPVSGAPTPSVRYCA
jgi:hypothetical protein